MRHITLPSRLRVISGKELKSQLHMGEVNPTKAKYSVRNKCFVKPSGEVVWTSSYTDKGSEWINFCSTEFESQLFDEGYVCDINDDAKIVEINDLQDLKELIRKYSNEKCPRILGMDFIDFEKLAEDFDGIHLTDDGQWRTRMTQPSLYGWDVESTVFFKNVFKDCKKVDLTPIIKKCRDTGE